VVPHPSLAVTGATGRLGGRVARRLAERGVAPRLVVRDAARAPSLPGAEVVEVGGYADAEGMRRAVEGVDVVLLVSAGESPDRIAVHRAAVDAIAEAGAPHVVYTSFVGAAPDATFLLVRDHWATEAHLAARGLRWTALRHNLYADLVPDLAGADGVIRGPAGEGRVGLVAVDDLADAAAAVLLDAPSHVGAVHELTGPEALSLDEAARTAAEVLGRPLSYEPEAPEQARASRADLGAPSWLVEAWISTYTAIAAGEMDVVTDAVERLTGHPATPLAEALRRR
jgi:NAD(P)H dehydrogenase (quinone)